MDERLRKQMDFILELDKEKNIFRQTHLSGHGRNENDAEHAWHMAIMAYLLAEYSNEPIDVAKTMLMCLTHDVVEIDAGDTYAYDPEGKKTQAAREEAAKERLYSMLPDDQKKVLMELFEEFEEAKTPEAKFARAMDNLQPITLNNSNGGSDWAEHGVGASQVYARQLRTKPGSEILYRITDDMIKNNIKRGSLRDDLPKPSFRLAVMDDLDEIASIYDRIHTEEESGRVSIGWSRSIYPTRSTGAAAIEAGDMFVEIVDERIVASGRINKIQVPEYADATWEYEAPDDEVMVLHTMTIDPLCEGRGYAGAFVKFYEEYSLEHGCRFLRIDTNRINSRARSMYGKLGYKEISIVPCNFNGIEGIDLVCLEKKL